jgi:hypothetical protein
MVLMFKLNSLNSFLQVLCALLTSELMDLLLFHSVQTKLQLSISLVFLNDHQGRFLMMLLTKSPLFPLQIQALYKAYYSGGIIS